MNNLRHLADKLIHDISYGGDFTLHAGEATVFLDAVVELWEKNQEKKKVIQDMLTWLNGPYGRTIDTDYSNVIRQRLAELSK